jgi:hypothetical protein
MKRKGPSPPKPVKASLVPVTVEMLNEMEDRLSLKIDAGLHRVHSEISGVKSELSGVKSEMHRIALLVEEQNARNKFVLDGYAQLYELIERKLG